MNVKKPKHLHTDAVPKYKELFTIVEGSMREGDENLLAVLANTYLSYTKAKDELLNRPVTIAGERLTRKNPAHDMVKDDIKIIESLTAHFGLSPKSRREKFETGKDETDDFDKI